MSPLPRVSIIAAVARNQAIGRKSQMPWRLPEDLKRFRRLTLGHAVVMGRRTFDSIGKPLPGRDNIVVTLSRESRALDGPEGFVYHFVVYESRAWLRALRSFF